jgi:nitrogenase-associated protein
VTDVIFYEKTGCSGNARQKAALEAAGHRVEARDLRDVAWSRARLLTFLGDLPIAEWFNPNAPAVKRGEIVPGELNESLALGLLQADPLLIRRPLLEAAGRREVGFDVARIDAWLGLGEAVRSAGNVLNACQHGHDPAHRCHDPRAA